MTSEAVSPSGLFPSKLVRPRLHGVFPRERLFRVLAERDKVSAIWVCGPAGSGKTTLLNSYLDAGKTACIWYQLDESDGDVASFFYHLGCAARVLVPGDSADFPLLTPEFFASIPLFARRFFETIRFQVQAPCAIVLDNYQEVRPEALLHEVLCTAIDALIPGVRLYVCSRQKPPTELARHRANCALHIIGWKHLQLDIDEACGIAACFVGPRYAKSDVEILQAKTDGWVAGLLLLLQRGEFEDIEPCRLVNHTPSEIFDYFGSVLFHRLDPDIQHILICLSHLPRITPLTAEKLAGANTPDILEKLHIANAFTYRTIGETPIYSFHPLFQEYLQSQCRKRFSPAEMRQVQSLSAAALAAEGEFDDAVGLYLRAGQVDEAINLIVGRAPGLHMQGRIQTLSGWLNALPGNLIETLPWLVFWRGVCTVPNCPRQGQAYFNKALAIFEDQGDPLGCYLALSGVIEAVIFQANDYSALDPYIEKYSELHARWGEIEVAEVQLHLTSSMLMAMVMRRGNSPELPIWVDRGWELLRGLQDVNVTLKLFIGLLTLQTISGDFAGSQNVLDALKDAIPEKGPKLPHLFHKNLRACHCWSVGRFEEGLASAERGIQIELECGIRLLYSGLRTHAACAAIGLGRMDLARRYLDEAASVVPLEGNWIQVLYHSMRSWYELRAGNLPRARFHAQIHYEKAIAAGNNLSMPLSHALMAVIFYESGQPDEAKKHLDMGFAASRGYSGQLYDFKGYLLKSRIALAEGDLAMATQMLREGFAIGARRNYRYFNHWQPEVMAKLCVEALKRHIEPDYVRSLVVEHRLVPQTPPTDVPGWPWPVRMITLGCFRLEKCGEPVPSSRKAQQRPLAMLKYLVARGGRNIPTHEIEEVLWPDADGDAASNVFSTTLHRLRRLLGNDDAVRFAEAALSLDEFLVWVDVQALEQCSLRVARTVAGTCDAADLQPLRDTLIALYQGPFLPGEPSAWAIPIRQRLQERFFTALCALAQAFEELGRFDDAAQCCRYGLTLDPLVESLYYPLMRITFSQGRKNEALQLYERYRSLLDSELGLTPSEMLESVKKSLFA